MKTSKATAKKTSKSVSNRPIKKNIVKHYVLDTNVILHDWKSFLNFEENIVVIPIVVLGEIDSFKKGFEMINYNAREFSRELDEIINGHDFTNGCSLPNGGYLKVITESSAQTTLKSLFTEDTPDNRILSTVKFVADSIGKENTVLVTKDINLRVKAKALGLKAEDYTTDKVTSVDKQYKGITTVPDIDSSIIDALHDSPQKQIEYKDLYDWYTPYLNEYFILKSKENTSAIVRYIGQYVFQLVKSKQAYGVTPRNVEQICAIDALTDPNIQLVTLSGLAGSGKTLCTLAAALECKSEYKQILIMKSVISLPKEQVGFLPGDMEEKLGPIYQSYFDNLDVIKHINGDTSKKSQNLQEAVSLDKIKMEPLTYIRGRSLPRNFIIIDEAQNTTRLTIRTLLTRVGEGSKIVVMGDVSQIDDPYLDEQSNGLSYVVDGFKDSPLHAHITFTKGERSKLSEEACNRLK